MKLYQYAPAFASFADLTEDGELSPEVLAQLDSLELSLQEKVDNICRLIRHLEGQVLVRETESERMMQAAARDERQIKSLKQYLQFQLELLERPNMKTELFSVRVQANSQPSVKFDGEIDDLPEHFKRTKVEANNAAVIKAWRDGQPLPDGFTVETGRHLRIS